MERKDLLNLTDEEFINHDIQGLKKNILKALENGDTNAHGKWLNSLRDALELKEKLKSKNSNSLSDKIIYDNKVYKIISLSESLKEHNATMECEENFKFILRRTKCTYNFNDCSLIDCFKTIFEDLNIIYDKVNLENTLVNYIKITKNYNNMNVYDIICDLFEYICNATNRHYIIDYDYINDIVRIKEK